MNKKQIISLSKCKLCVVLIACFTSKLSFAAEHQFSAQQNEIASRVSKTVPTSLEQKSHFNIIVQSNQMILSWSTIELKDAKYLIYRSDDGNNFVKIGEKVINGNPNEPTLYIFHDEAPSKGLSHYKLVKQDNNGNETEIASKKVFLSSNQSGVLSANAIPKINRI
jgi:hypothetical protein